MSNQYLPYGQPRAEQRSKLPRILVGGAVVVVIAAATAVVTYKAFGPESSTVAATESSSATATSTSPSDRPTPSAAPSPRPAPAAKVARREMLLNADELNSVMHATDIVAKLDWLHDQPVAANVTPTSCTPVAFPGTNIGYDAEKTSGFFLQQAYEDVPDDKPAHDVLEAVISYRSNDEAKQRWDTLNTSYFSRCVNTTATYRDGNGGHFDSNVGQFVQTDDLLTTTVTGTSATPLKCQHSVALRANLIIDVRACSRTSVPTAETAAIIEQIKHKIDNR